MDNNQQIPAVFALRCQVQQYDWGKLGADSSVAKYAAAAHDAEIDAEKPYAELWMGTHTNAPSTIHAPDVEHVHGQLLGELVKQQANTLLTAPIAEQYSDLPFLFKVLSIRKALSIQAHPDKQLAADLHAKQPDRYRDPNHKPEMAIALTEFEALCGFRPVEDIAMNLQTPELIRLIGESAVTRFVLAANADDEVDDDDDEAEADLANNLGQLSLSASASTTSLAVKEALKELFGNLMRSDPAEVAEAVTTLCARLARSPAASEKGTLEELIIRLNTQFPGDIGCLCPLLLNVITLKPGEALYLGANEPHAYISGDCIECMAASDNVVRAGLTPKFIDVDVLVNMLTYNTRSTSQQLLAPESLSSTTQLYNPPISEFSVMRTRLTDANTSETQAGRRGPSVLIVTEGSGQLKADTLELTLEAGQVYFIQPDTSIAMTASSEILECYRAYCELA
ncbi:RmlC-like cupin domain-containing protein [Syncephalis plumigaleata]|nr:RmlC-like cupin domain-containing protein [Syncephalis plumigaleata]